MRPEVASYVVQRWVHEEYTPLREKRGLTTTRAIVRARELRVKYSEEFCLRTITTFCLDNPYRNPLAQKVMLKEARRAVSVKRKESVCGVRAEGAGK